MPSPSQPSRVYVDIETYSRVDLRKTNVYRYAEDAEFQILMAAWSVDGDPIEVTLDEEETLDTLLAHLAAGATFVAHNAAFERVCFSRLLGLPPGEYLDPERWHDTQAVAAEYGYPQTLKFLAKALGAEDKDEAGTRLINLFCRPSRRGERVLPEERPEEWNDFIAYCVQDVSTLVGIDEALGDFPTEEERRAYIADQRVNDLGLHVDLDLARHAVEAGETNRLSQELEVMSITGVNNPGSTAQLQTWLTSTGLDVPNLRAETVEALLAEPSLRQYQRRVLELRQELALSSAKKFEALLESASTGDRLRGAFKFFGAHTGRWAGRGPQPHNLPRLAFDNDIDVELTIGELLAGEGASSEDLKRLVRPAFLGPLTVVDYSAIEARVVAWLAGESWALEAFHAGRDIYVETAERMGGLTRTQGKVAVLALGYNGGINSLKALTGDPAALAALGNASPGVPYGVPLRSLVESSPMGHHILQNPLFKGYLDDPLASDEVWERAVDEALMGLVKQWRRANPHIVTLWANLGNAMSDLERVGPHLRISGAGSTRRLHLPSGRAIHYHGVKWERYVVRDPKTNRAVHKEGWRYDDPKKAGHRIGTYGGRLAENATQAVARDLMAAAIVRLQEAGYNVVGHVHDEILVEGHHDVETISEIMCDSPEWAKGLPVAGEGFTCDRYKKG